MDREHLLVFDDRDTADEVASELRSAGFAEVRVVREALAGEDDSESHEWAVHVVTPDDDAHTAAMSHLARDRDGWYDPEP